MSFISSSTLSASSGANEFIGGGPGPDLNLNHTASGDLNLELRQSWRSFDIREAVKKTHSAEESDKRGTDIEIKDEEEAEEQLMGIYKHLIAPPGSNMRLAWDLIGALLILYDILSIPLGFFDIEETDFTVFVDNFALMYWTLNVYSTLTTGYVAKGVTVVSPRKIRINYLRTWFVVDVVTIVPDWVFIAMGSGGIDQLALLRTARLVRIVRLLRLVKLKKIIEWIQDSLDSEFSSICFSVLRMLVILVVINHVICCCWYGISAVEANTDEPAWTKTYLPGGIYVTPISTKYLIALHWCITQFTPASMDVQPLNDKERLFAVGAVLFALIGFAYVVGSITASLAQLRQLTEQTSKDFWLLRRFFRQRGVESHLAIRIKRFLEHAHAQQKNTMSIKQVTLLNLLSKQLMEELQTAINLPHLTIHPLLKNLRETSFITMIRLCTGAVDRMSLATNDTLFEEMQAGTSMYFLSRGQIQYTRSRGSIENLEAGAGWISEAIIWSAGWEHMGEVKASMECEVLAIGPKVFEDTVMVAKPVAAVMAQYSRDFVRWLMMTGNFSDIYQSTESSAVVQNFIFTPSQLRGRTSSSMT